MKKLLLNRNALYLLYEDDTQNSPLNAYNKTCSWLDLESESPDVQLRRTGGGSLCDKVDNYEEVAHELSNTKYEFILNY